MGTSTTSLSTLLLPSQPTTNVICMDAHSIAKRVAKSFMGRAKTAGYYKYGGQSLSEVVKRWQEDGDKLYDPEKITHKRHSMYAHGLFPINDLWKLREYTWSKFDARRTPAEWDDLLDSLRAEGLQEPLHVMIGREGGAKIGEGNHRIAIARELGMRELPVKFHFYSGPVTKQKREKPKTPKKVPPKVEKEVREVRKDMTPEEEAELSRMVDDLLKFF